MTVRQTLTGILIAIFLLVIIVELVRRRKLGEEYSFLWIAAGIGVLLLSIFHSLLYFISNLLGIGAPAFTLFVIGFLFLALINLHYSIRISTLTRQVKNLIQKIALLENDLEERQR